MKAASIRVLAVDDSETFLHGVASLIALERDMVLAGLAGNGQDALVMARTVEPDVILMDLRIPWTTGAPSSQLVGLKTIEAFQSLNGEVPIVVISSFSERRWLVQAMDAGAQGYLSKEISADEVIASLRAATAGELVLTAEQRAWRQESKRVLTPREQQVLHLLAEGKSDADIADRLLISPKTARKHTENIRHKLGVSSRGEAVAEARRRGLL